MPKKLLKRKPLTTRQQLPLNELALVLKEASQFFEHCDWLRRFEHFDDRVAYAKGFGRTAPTTNQRQYVCDRFEGLYQYRPALGILTVEQVRTIVGYKLQANALVAHPGVGALVQRKALLARARAAELLLTNKEEGLAQLKITGAHATELHINKIEGDANMAAKKKTATKKTAGKKTAAKKEKKDSGPTRPSVIIPLLEECKWTDEKIAEKASKILKDDAGFRENNGGLVYVTGIRRLYNQGKLAKYGKPKKQIERIGGPAQVARKAKAAKKAAPAKRKAVKRKANVKEDGIGF